jgi:cytochrome P450
MVTDDDYDTFEVAAKVNLTDEKLYSTELPERIWRTLRKARKPVRSHGLRTHWAVTGYHQIQEIYRNSGRFSSEKGMHLGEKATDSVASAGVGGMSLLVTDDPAHAEMRKALGAAFTPKALHRLKDSTQEIARKLVRAAAEQPAVDFVASVAAPLPAIVICELLGVPEDDRDRVVGLTQTAFGGSGYATGAAQLAAHAELFSYCDKLITRKRREPGDDVATVLANATMYGEPMKREIAVMNCHDLIAGGNETARHTSSAAALTMVDHRDEWARLRAGEADLDTATEEIFRFEAPVNHVMRVLLEDVEVGGVAMRRGEFVTMWLRSANRDDEVFDRPDDLVFDRRPNKHLTFGLGSHYCIAAFLARIEVGAIVRALAEIVAGAELAGKPDRLESNFFRGYRTLPLSLSRR